MFSFYIVKIMQKEKKASTGKLKKNNNIFLKKKIEK